MASGVTFWGRVGDKETLEALAFLRKNGYGANRTRDIDADPPHGEDWEELRKGMGGHLSALVDPKHPAQGIGDDEMPAWFSASTKRIRAPILLTPRGAVAGFGERRWTQFLDIGRGR